MSPVKIKDAVIAAPRFPAEMFELAAECADVLTRIDRPILTAIDCYLVRHCPKT